MPLTYLEVCVSHALGKAALTSAWDAVLTVSVTADHHELDQGEAAKIGGAMACHGVPREWLILISKTLIRM